MRYLSNDLSDKTAASLPTPSLHKSICKLLAKPPQCSFCEQLLLWRIILPRRADLYSLNTQDTRCRFENLKSTDGRIAGYMICSSRPEVLKQIANALLNKIYWREIYCIRGRCRAIDPHCHQITRITLGDTREFHDSTASSLFATELHDFAARSHKSYTDKTLPP